MHNWNRTQIFKQKYQELGISQLQPALACSFFVCPLKEKKKKKSDILAALVV